MREKIRCPAPGCERGEMVSEKTGKWIKCPKCKGVGEITKIKKPGSLSKNAIFHQIMMKWTVPEPD